MQENDISLAEVVYCEREVRGKCTRKIGNEPAFLSKIVRYNHMTSVYLEHAYETIIKGSVLGVVSRGTDYRREALDYRSGGKATKKIAEIKLVLARVREEIKTGGFEFVFVATEDEEYLELFKKEFQDKLLYVDSKRVRFKDGDEKNWL